MRQRDQIIGAANSQPFFECHSLPPHQGNYSHYSCFLIFIMLWFQSISPIILRDMTQALRVRWFVAWWRHQMETFSALLAICAGNSPVSGEFPAQRPVTRSFDVFFDLRLDWRLSKHSWGWWLETPSWPLWRQSNGLWIYDTIAPVPLK